MVFVSTEFLDRFPGPSFLSWWVLAGGVPLAVSTPKGKKHNLRKKHDIPRRVRQWSVVLSVFSTVNKREFPDSDGVDDSVCFSLPWTDEISRFGRSGRVCPLFRPPQTRFPDSDGVDESLRRSSFVLKLREAWFCHALRGMLPMLTAVSKSSSPLRFIAL